MFGIFQSQTSEQELCESILIRHEPQILRASEMLRNNFPVQLHSLIPAYELCVLYYLSYSTMCPEMLWYIIMLSVKLCPDWMHSWMAVYFRGKLQKFMVSRASENRRFMNSYRLFLLINILLSQLFYNT